MADGAARAAWEHTAAILTILANANRDPKRPPARFEAFYPFKPDRPTRQTVDITVLRDAFVRAKERSRKK